MKKKFYFLSFLLINQLCAKTLIITHVYNRPDFIEIQDKTFKHFIEDAYEFVVFNDASNENMATQIKEICAKHDIHHIRIPQEIHTRPYLPRLPGDPLHRPNIRHANCVQYSLDTLGFNHNGIVFIIDSDMFLVRPLNISEYMKDKDIVAYVKGSDNNVFYLCPNLCFLHMNRLPDKRSLNFNCGVANGASVDSGGWTYFYLKQHPELRVISVEGLWSYLLFCPHYIDSRPIDYTASEDARREVYIKYGFNEKEIQFFLKRPDTFEIYMDKCFLHYRAGTNYSNLSQEFHNNKTRIFNEFINDILQDTYKTPQLLPNINKFRSYQVIKKINELVRFPTQVNKSRNLTLLVKSRQPKNKKNNEY
jgi:hypothetical protein